jgi:uncharacterized membrane protein YvlD (DUF360 family)
LVFSKGIQTIFLTGGGLTLVTMFAKPVINLLLLPLNLISFGLFSWVSSAIALYLVTLIVSDFKILKFTYAGYSTDFFSIPSLDFKGILAFIAFSFIISFISSFMYWLTK